MPEVSDFWIKFNYWVLSNREDLRRWWVMVLIGIDVFLVIFVLANGVVAVISYWDMKQTVADIGSTRMITESERARNAPQDLTTQAVEEIIAEGKDTVFVASVTNPNTTWSVASLTYFFSAGQESTAFRESMLAPGEQRYLISSGSGSQGTLELETINWMRTPPGSLPTIDVTLTDPKHSFITVVRQGRPVSVSIAETTLKNNSLYSIKSAKIVALVYNGSRLIGAQQVYADNIKAFEERDITIQFLDVLPVFDRIEVHQEINVLDRDNLEI